MARLLERDRAFCHQRLDLHDAAAGHGWLMNARSEARGDAWYQRAVLGERGPIEGYLDRTSVLPGDEIVLHIAASAPQEVALHVFREADDGAGCLLQASFAARPQPVRPGAWCCGAGWPESGRVRVPPDWPSGAYRLELRGADGAAPSGDATMLLVVRSASPGAASAALLVVSTFTYAAYNNWGGHSLYSFSSRAEGALPERDAEFAHVLHPMGGGLQSSAVSRHRPGHGYGGTIEGRFCTWELPFVRWCAAAGVPLEFATNEDIDGEGGLALLQRYRLLLSVGHDEYWTRRQRLHVEAFVDGGGNCAVLGGNSCCWQVRLDGGDAADSRVVCHKQFWDAQPAGVLADPAQVTGLMAHPRIHGPEGPPSRLIGLDVRRGGYHRCHGLLMGGSGGYAVCRADAWPLEVSGLAEGVDLGGALRVVGFALEGD
jgi:hypothetical protein